MDLLDQTESMDRKSLKFDFVPWDRSVFRACRSRVMLVDSPTLPAFPSVTVAQQDFISRAVISPLASPVSQVASRTRLEPALALSATMDDTLHKQRQPVASSVC